jgi:hypothetical protein
MYHVLNLVWIRHASDGLSRLRGRGSEGAERGEKVLKCKNTKFRAQGGGRQEGDISRRITVTSSIFIFRTWFFAQIVENRRGRLSKPFLVLGTVFQKVIQKPDLVEVCPRARGSDSQISGAIQLPYKSVFVITFQKKMYPGPKNGLERRPSRFSTICAKNQVPIFPLTGASHLYAY